MVRKSKDTQDTQEEVVASLPKKPKSRMEAVLASDLVSKINKTAGGIMIRSASEKTSKKVHKISTGIFTLDFALGGGYQVGMIHTAYGPQSSGKTSVFLRTIANAQQQCGNCWTPQIPRCKCGEYEAPPTKESKELKTEESITPSDIIDSVEIVATEEAKPLPKLPCVKCKTKQVIRCECNNYREVLAVYIDVEGTLDLEWATKLGVDRDRMAVTIPEYAEETLDILETLLRSGEWDIIVVDSLAFMSPKAEVEASNAKESMGLQARSLAKGIRKVVSALNAMEMKPEARRPTVLLTNQIRMQIGVMFGNPETLSGGKAPRYAAATEVRFSSGKYHKPGEKDEDGNKEGSTGDSLGKPDYADFRFKVEKNKTAVPKIEAEYRLICSPLENKKLGDIWNESALVSFAQKTGLLTGSGSSWHYDNKNYKGKSAFESALVYDKTLQEQLWQDLIALTSQ